MRSSYLSSKHSCHWASPKLHTLPFEIGLLPQLWQLLAQPGWWLANPRNSLPLPPRALQVKDCASIPGFFSIWVLGVEFRSLYFLSHMVQPELSPQPRTGLFIVCVFITVFIGKSRLVLKQDLNAGVTGVCLAQFTNFLLPTFSCLLIQTTHCSNSASTSRSSQQITMK